MSIDLSVYSARPDPINRAELEAALKNRGWSVLFLDDGTMKEFSGGVLSNALLYGTKQGSVLKTVRDLLAKGDKKQLETLLENEDVGGCGVYATIPFNARDIYSDDFEQQVGPVIAEHILKATSAYNVGTSAGRTDLAFDFQEAVWKALGEVTGGLLEDPQTGKYIRFGAKGEEVLAEVDDSEGSPIGDLKKYFDAAKAAGFPLDANKDEANLNTEKLLQADLERLLKFTREYFPKGDPSGSAMVMMILEEYQQKKGTSFARDNAGWFAQMQEKYGEF